jgi:hypothetical protein
MTAPIEGLPMCMAKLSTTSSRNALALTAVLLCAVLLQTVGAAERINHEGRILGPFPIVTNAILFNTASADAVMSALQVYPRDHAWNEDISRRPVLPNSTAMIHLIATNLASGGTGRTNMRAFQEMNFALVPDNQPLVPITFVTYPSQSDIGPYPIPANMPVESWPTQTGGLSLYDWQRDINDDGGDRHSIIIQPGTGNVWETWQAKLNVAASSSNWQAANGAKWNLNSNALRPLDWTSADAAGLSMLGGLVRYDECQRSMVEHAIRLIVKSTRRAYIYPATHHASVPNTTNPNKPAMGERLRLKSDFVIPESWPTADKAVARALKKYGAIVADNGNFFSISVVPDSRWPANVFRALTNLSVGHFEVIQTTGANEGPRAPGAPIVHAGDDRTAGVDEDIPLAGAILYTNAAPLTTAWRLYSGPASAQFANASATNTTVRFALPGQYTLLLSASNGLHTTAYDAAVFTIINGIRVAIDRTPSNAVLRWTGGAAPFAVETTATLPSTNWTTVTTLSSNQLGVAATNPVQFFRVRGQ